MKKVQSKYTVVRELTELEIKELASNIWMKKHLMWLFIPIIVCMLAAIAISATIDSDIGVQILGLGVIIWFLVFYYKYYKAGKLFWKSINDKSQPIKM